MPLILQSAITELSLLIQREGLMAGLAFLNRRVPHRFTAIYKLEAMTVRNLYLFDREGAILPEALSVIPLNDSFCQHALSDGAILIDDSRLDPRVDGSPFKGVVVGYHGLPLLSRDGALFGTLCHFDFVPQTLSDSEFEFLQKAARVIAAYL